MRSICISLQTSRSLIKRCHTTVILAKKEKFNVKQGDETTLYIKGFLSKGESVEDYHLWHYSHNRISKKHYWNETAKGWNWNCGDLEYPIPFITLTNFAYNLYKSSKFIKAHPAMIATSLLVDAGYHIGRLIHQYRLELELFY